MPNFPIVDSGCISHEGREAIINNSLALIFDHGIVDYKEINYNKLAIWPMPTPPMARTLAL